MNDPQIAIRPIADPEIPAVIDLMTAQEIRLSTLMPCLRGTRSRRHLETALANQSNHTQPLVALDEQGRIRGYAQPSVWKLKAQSILRSFLTACNGIVQNLALPNPADEDASIVASALLTSLIQFWQDNNTTGDLIRWPGMDTWLEPVLEKQGFQLDSICAIHSLQPLITSRATNSPSLFIRVAQPHDEEALVQLFHKELLFHERYTPFVRSSPQVLHAFRSKLEHCWQGMSLEDGAPFVLVVEQNHEIVAMAENTLLVVEADDEPGFTPLGRYWCIDNVSIREDMQGQGIGHLLIQAVEDAKTTSRLDLDGYMLWYNPDNPKAARFWQSLGFQPLWITYQRLKT